MRITATCVMVAMAAASLMASEHKTTMDKLPVPVQEAVAREAAGGKVRGLTVETENGTTLYEAELDVNGHLKDLSFDDQGTIVVTEEPVALADVPAAARDAILNATGSKAMLIERVTEKGTVTYEAHYRHGLKNAEVKVDASGQAVK